jgi:hypothetical protein
VAPLRAGQDLGILWIATPWLGAGIFGYDVVAKLRNQTAADTPSEGGQSIADGVLSDD